MSKERQFVISQNETRNTIKVEFKKGVLMTADGLQEIFPYLKNEDTWQWEGSWHHFGGAYISYINQRIEFIPEIGDFHGLFGPHFLGHGAILRLFPAADIDREILEKKLSDYFAPNVDEKRGEKT